MVLLIAILSVGLLLAGFLALTLAEAQTGRRAFSPLRLALDARVSSLRTFLRRADIGAFLFHSARALAEYAVRGAVHGILVAVRAIERWLTRAVRHLRGREQTLENSKAVITSKVARLGTLLGIRKKEGTSASDSVE